MSTRLRVIWVDKATGNVFVGKRAMSTIRSYAKSYRVAWPKGSRAETLGTIVKEIIAKTARQTGISPGVYLFREPKNTRITRSLYGKTLGGLKDFGYQMPTRRATPEPPLFQRAQAIDRMAAMLNRERARNAQVPAANARMVFVPVDVAERTVWGQQGEAPPPRLQPPPAQPTDEVELDDFVDAIFPDEERF